MPSTAVSRCTLLILLLSCLCTAQAAASTAIYDIRAENALVGISSISWTAQNGGRVASASTELPDTLVQHDRLWLDPEGWPMRYRLSANVQGHSIQIDVRRSKSELIETVTQGSQRHTQTFPSPAPVNFIDNNSLDGLQALLDRLHGKPKPGSKLQVFVPQAQSFGTLHFDAVRSTHERLDGKRLALRSISAQLSVGRSSVPLTLWLDPADGRLLRFAQPLRQVTMTLRNVAQSVTATPSLAETLMQQQRCLTAKRLMVPTGSIDLIGELTLPHQGAGPWPAVLLAPDRGALDLNGDSASMPVSNSIYKQLAYALACQGIAVLRYNTRGVSPSGGRWAATTVETNANDIASLLSALNRQPGIDPQRLILAGHAEGGLIALYTLNGLKPQPAALILLETPGKPLAQVLTDQLLAPARALGAATTQIESLQQAAEQALAAIRDSHGQQLTLNGALAGNPLARRLAPYAGLLRSELLLDPTRLAAKVKIPMLIVQGGKDLRVPPANAELLQQADHRAQRLDFADMTDTLVPSSLPPLSASFNLPDSLIEPALASDLARWIRRHTAATSNFRRDSSPAHG